MAQERFRIRWVGSSVLGLLLLCASVAAAQLTTGTISGTVADQSGGAVPGAEITITNTETGISRATVTGPQGRYNAPSLPLGNYEVRVALTGFQTSIRSGIQLTVGRNAVVNHTLQVGEVAQAVTVTGEVGLVETTTATVSNLINEEQVVDLPLNNRDLTSLAFMSPGVLRVPQRNRQGVFSGMGQKLTVSGARQTHNVFLTDGMTSGDISNNLAGSTGGASGVDTIQEFQIITNNYSAEYKSAAGAIVSMVTRSGTNALHGSAFEFLRNDALDANNFFNNSDGRAKPPFNRNQFGGSVGGPILQDRTFFFASFEGLRERKPIPDQVRLPGADALQGILPDETIPVDPAVRPYLDLLPIPGVDLPINRTFDDGTVQLVGVQRQPTTEDFITGKLDHQFSDPRLGFLSGTWTYMRSNRDQLGIIGDINNDAEDGGAASLVSNRDSVAASLTSIFSPTVLNELRFGWNRTNPTGSIPITDRDFGGPAPQGGLMFNDNPFGLVGQIGVSGIDTWGFRGNSSAYQQEVFTVSDDVSITRGNHTFKFGGVVNRTIMDQTAATAGTHGIWEFRNYELFLRNIPRRFEVHLPSELVNLDDFNIAPGWEFQGELGRRPNRNAKQWGFGGYIQDNWRMRPSFTLNLGLRYEFVTLPREVNGATSALVNFQDEKVTIGPLAGNNPTTKSFSPRVGFAWAPGDQRTSLRGGIGMFYVHPGFYHWRTAYQVMPPFILSTRLDTQDRRGTIDDSVTPENPNGVKISFPDAYFTQTQYLTDGLRPNIRPPEYNQENTYIARWSLNLQREVGTNWLLSSGYTGSRGVHLWMMERAELSRWRVCAERMPCGPGTGRAQVGEWPENPGPGRYKYFVEDLGLINPNFGVNRPQMPSGTSNYHGATFSAQQRLAAGLQWQVSYTLSKSIDMASGVTSGGDNLPQGQRGIYYFDNHIKRSLSSADIRNNLVSNFTWNIPGTGVGGLGSALLDGWQINGILTLTDGHPLSVLDEANAGQDDAINQTDLLFANLVPGGDNNPVTGSPNAWLDTRHFIPSACTGTTRCQEGDPDWQPGFFGTVGRNTLTSPGLATFDFSLFKNIPVSETTQFQFRAEFFNIFNRANFGVPDTDALFLDDGRPNEQAGEIRETATDARQIQFGLKFIF